MNKWRANEADDRRQEHACKKRARAAAGDKKFEERILKGGEQAASHAIAAIKVMALIARARNSLMQHRCSVRYRETLGAHRHRHRKRTARPLLAIEAVTNVDGQRRAAHLIPHFIAEATSGKRQGKVYFASPRRAMTVPQFRIVVKKAREL